MVKSLDSEYFIDQYPPDALELTFSTPLRISDDTHRLRHSTLLAEKRDLIDEYIERRFLLERYLPQAQGRVLDVGVNKPNLNDSQALPNPDLHWTIDIDPAVAPYGSARHETIDFFDYTSEQPFDHVIMFGLVGTPNNRTAQDAHITFDLNDALIEHALELVAPEGFLVIGPELSGESRSAGDEDVQKWLNYFAQSSPLSENFTLVYALRGRCNLVTVFHKNP